jgi:hypothetical protein
MTIRETRLADEGGKLVEALPVRGDAQHPALGFLLPFAEEADDVLGRADVDADGVHASSLPEGSLRS